MGVFYFTQSFIHKNIKFLASFLHDFFFRRFPWSKTRNLIAPKNVWRKNNVKPIIVKQSYGSQSCNLKARKSKRHNHGQKSQSNSASDCGCPLLLRALTLINDVEADRRAGVIRALVIRVKCARDQSS